MALKVEDRLKLSLSMQGNKRGVGNKSRTGHIVSGRNLSDESRLKMSLGRKGKIASEETRLKLSIAAKARRHTEESKCKLSLAGTKNIKAGKIGYTIHKPYPYVTRTDNVVILRNSWEYKVAVYLDELGLNWVYEQSWITHNGRSYLPDFFIWDNAGELIKIIEVKGSFPESAKQKFYMFKDYLESIDIQVELWTREYMRGMGLYV